jgi:pimeloyl-ACP methyl ester carboxylesterase
MGAQRVARSRDGVEIAYATHGAAAGAEAPAVVLVHGWAGNRTYWDHQVGYLGERNLVVAVDLGGHGGSGLGRAEWSLAAFGDDVVAVVDEVGAQRVALVGHSMGGDAIVHAARQLGDRVAGLVWIDVFRSLGKEPESSPEQVEAFLAPFRADFESAVVQFVRNLLPAAANGKLVESIVTDMTAAPREVALGSLRYARNRQPAILAALPHLLAPIVAINPDIAPTDIDSMRQHRVESIVLTDVGHFPMIEDPEQFNPILATTLALFRGSVL